MVTASDPDGDPLVAGLAALRPSQNDLLARALREQVRRDLAQVPDEPFRLGRFTVLERLGSGGMGTVFVAYDPDLDRKIALKVLHARGEAARQAALREGRALARLRHPNVVVVYEVGVLEEHVFVAMEYVEGTDLRSWLRTPRTRAQILDRLVEAGRGLAAAHAVDLVHRDFKPENVVVDADGRARVIDFGLARPIEDLPGATGGSTAATTPRSVGGGTPGYIAPERQAGEPGDHRADQYSFCVTCCEALVGERPSDAGPAAKLPNRIVRALRRGLSPAPARRFPSMDALLVELSARPARRWAGALVALAAVCALAGYAVGQRERAAPRCISPRAQMAGTWSEARADAIGAAFAVTGAPFARQLWTSARAAIDRHVEAWIAAHARACHETAVLGVASPELYGRRVLCLEDRRLRLGALLDRFAAADRDAVVDALRAIDDLPPVEACDTPGAIEPLSLTDPAPVRIRRALRDELDRAHAELATGGAVAALERVPRLLAWARALGDRNQRIEVLLLAANADFEAWHVDLGIERAREALHLAIEASQQHQAAQAILELVWMQFQRHEDPALLEERLDLAEAFTRQAGDPPRLRQLLLLYRGLVLSRRMRYVEAVASLEAARDAALQLGDRNTAARILDMLAMEHDELGDHATARAALEKAMAELEPLVGALHPALAEIHSNLASVTIAIDDYEAATRHIDRGATILRANFGEAHPLVAIAHLQLGTIHALQGRPEEALAEHRRARALFERAEGPRHPHVALAICATGASLLAVDRPDAALLEIDRAVALQAELLQPTDCDRLKCLVVRGTILHALGRHADTLATLDPTLDYARASGCPTERSDVEFALARGLLALRGARARARILELLDAAAPGLDPQSADQAETMRAALR